MPRHKAAEFTADGRPIFARNKKGEPICGAKTRAKGVCQRSVGLYDNGRCHLHGGPSTGPPLKHGVRSKLWEKLGIADQADAIREDPQINSHRANIELIEGLIAGMADTVGPALPIWKEALDHYNAALENLESEDGLDAFTELGECLRNGLHLTTRLEQLTDLLEQSRKHKESENKREERVSQSLSARQANSLVSALLVVIFEEITDERIRARIGERFARLVGRPDSARPLPIQSAS